MAGPGFYKLALEDGIAGLVYLRCVEAGIELPASVHKPLPQAYAADCR